MKGNKHALADEHKHKWQDYFILWKIKRREETFKFLKKIKWRSVTGRSEGKIEGISVRARGGESLARLKGFEAAQISNTALVTSRAWNLSLFGVALAANSPSSFSAWQKHFLNFPSLVLLFSQGKQSLYPWTHLPAVPNLSQTTRVTQTHSHSNHSGTVCLRSPNHIRKLFQFVEREPALTVSFRLGSMTCAELTRTIQNQWAEITS